MGKKKRKKKEKQPTKVKNSQTNSNLFEKTEVIISIIAAILGAGFFIINNNADTNTRLTLIEKELESRHLYIPNKEEFIENSRTKNCHDLIATKDSLNQIINKKCQ